MAFMLKNAEVRFAGEKATVNEGTGQVLVTTKTFTVTFTKDKTTISHRRWLMPTAEIATYGTDNRLKGVFGDYLFVSYNIIDANGNFTSVDNVSAPSDKERKRIMKEGKKAWKYYDQLKFEIEALKNDPVIASKLKFLKMAPEVK